jgi:hypothetical protein
MKFDEIFSICKQIQFEMKAENVQYGNEKPLGNTNSNQGFNRYAYCMYNPLRYIGPIGFGISMTYFVIDVATDSFNGWGKIQY